MPETIAFILFTGIVLYACLGGADFGAGIWDLFAGGDKRGGAFRKLVDHAIAPVWEANHVWLIFVLVFLWTGFPGAFATIFEKLWVPISLAALGIVFRGAAFAFRKFAHNMVTARSYGIAFAASSVITPFFFGTVAGSVASGNLDSWTARPSIIGGIIAVLTCAFLASVFLSYEAAQGNDARLTIGCRRRAIGSGIATGLAVLVCLVPLRDSAPALFHGLTHRALPLVLISALAGLTTLVLLWKHKLATARFTAVSAVAAVVYGWGVAQYPDLVTSQITIHSAAAPNTTLIGLLVTFVFAGVTVIPSLIYLYIVSQRWTRAGHESHHPHPG